MAISVIFLWMVCVPRKVKKWVKRFESWKEGLKSMKCTKKVIRSSTNFVARSNSHELYCLIVINSHSVDAAWLKITLNVGNFFVVHNYTQYPYTIVKQSWFLTYLDFLMSDCVWPPLEVNAIRPDSRLHYPLHMDPAESHCWPKS